MKGEYRAEQLEIEDSHWWYRGRRRVVRSALRTLDLPRPARGLDAGCGGGGNLCELAALGPATGMEPSPEAAAAARSREVGAVVEGVMESIPFEDSSFDFATSLDVLEHLDDDVAAMRELRRVVRPAGFLVVTVPAYPGLFGPHDVANEHRRRYLRRTLVDAAEEAGWTARFVTHFTSLLLPAIAPYRLIQRRRHPGEAQEESDFERTSASIIRPLELSLHAEAGAVARGVRLPAGLSILAVFE